MKAVRQMMAAVLAVMLLLQIVPVFPAFAAENTGLTVNEAVGEDFLTDDGAVGEDNAEPAAGGTAGEEDVETIAEGTAGEGDSSPISGAINGDKISYTWTFSDTTAAESAKTLDYSDEYAAIRIGLGTGDSVESSGLKFCGTGVDDNNTTLEQSGRYILFQPAYSGTISFDAQAALGSQSGRKLRLFYAKLAETDMNSAPLSSINKGYTSKPASWDDITTSNSAVSRSFNVEAGAIYILYTYLVDGTSSTIANLTYTSDFSDEVFISGAVDAERTSYTWTLNDIAAVESAKTLDYSDEYAAIRVGLGAGDSVESGVLEFSGSSTNDRSGSVSVGDTNRYVMIKPNYSGTITLDMSADLTTGSGSGRKGRLYYKEFPSGDMSSIALSDVIKTGPTITTSDFPAGQNTTQTGLTLDVKKGTVYVLFTYVYDNTANGGSSTISNLKYTADFDACISGSFDEESGIYSWVFEDATDKGNTLNYSDEYAAIRIGLGTGDTLTSAGLTFKGTGVDDSGMTLASSNRYILFQPAQNGTISFDAQAVLSGSSPKLRPYYAKLSVESMDSAGLSTIKKGNPGTDLKTISTSGAKESCEFPVEANGIYVLYTYLFNGSQSILSNLKYTISQPDR